MNPEKQDAQTILDHYLVNPGDGPPAEFSQRDLEEAAKIVREGGEAIRRSVIIPFSSDKVAHVLEESGMLAAAGGLNQKRFPVLLVENGDDGETYLDAGVADLIEEPVEDGEGNAFAMWKWIPAGATAGFDSLTVIVKNRDTGQDCGRGILRETDEGWRIRLLNGSMGDLMDIAGDSHVILLLG